jgi:hypothetical protein
VKAIRPASGDQAGSLASRPCEEPPAVEPVARSTIQISDVSSANVRTKAINRPVEIHAGSVSETQPDHPSVVTCCGEPVPSAFAV